MSDGDLSFDDDLIQEVGPALAYWIGKWTASLEARRIEAKSFRNRMEDDLEEIKSRLASIESGDVQRNKEQAVDEESSTQNLTWQFALKEVALPIILMGGGALLGFILANLQ